MGNATAAEVTGKIMVAAIIILFLVVILVLFLHLYAKWFWWRSEAEDLTNPREARRRRRFVFSPGQETALVKLGLDSAVLRSIEVVVVSRAQFKCGLECAVCLSELREGDKARMLPKCNHGFHVECIDMWFESHSTCPLCRNPVGAECRNVDGIETEGGGALVMGALEEGVASVSGVALNEFTMESRSYPTNVLFWGNEVQVNSGAGGAEEVGNVGSVTSGLVVDVPRHVSESGSSSSWRFGEEEQKSPMPTRMRTLKRLLSGDRRVLPSSSSSLDLEQGMSMNRS